MPLALDYPNLYILFIFWVGRDHKLIRASVHPPNSHDATSPTSPLLLSSPLPPLPLEVGPLKSSYGLGEHCELPQWGLEFCQNRILCILALKMTSGGNNFSFVPQLPYFCPPPPVPDDFFLHLRGCLWMSLIVISYCGMLIWPWILRRVLLQNLRTLQIPSSAACSCNCCKTDSRQQQLQLWPALDGLP